MWWIDIKYGFLEWFCKKTAKLRMKYTKFLLLKSNAYFNNDFQMTWDDVEVYDQWGLWFPLGFGIVSKKNFDWDNEFNEKYGYPLEKWKDEVHCTCEDHKNCGWTTYYFKDEFLDAKHYLIAGRKHINREVGDLAVDKDLKVELIVLSQKQLNDDLIQQAEWIKGGKKPFKIEFSDRAKEDFKKILGEEDAQELFDEHEKRNKEIDEGKDDNRTE